MIFAPVQSVTIIFQHVDSICGNQTDLDATGGAIIATSQQTTSVLVPANSSQLTLTASDCVGWENVKTFTILRVNGVTTPTISNLSALIELQTGELLVANNGTFDLRFASLLSHEITCSIDVGVVDCS